MKGTNHDYKALANLSVDKIITDNLPCWQVDFQAAAKYLDPPNFCGCQKSSEKNCGRHKRRQIGKIRSAAAKSSANLWPSLPFLLSLDFYTSNSTTFRANRVSHKSQYHNVYETYWLILSEDCGYICEVAMIDGLHT